MLSTLNFDHLNIDSIVHTRGNFSRKANKGFNLLADQCITEHEQLGDLVDVASEGHCCKFCKKKYTSLGKWLTLHESTCMFNPVVASNTTYEKFKTILPLNGICPGCNKRTCFS